LPGNSIVTREREERERERERNHYHHHLPEFSTNGRKSSLRRRANQMVENVSEERNNEVFLEKEIGVKKLREKEKVVFYGCQEAEYRP
jgi:hypothetical protein